MLETRNHILTLVKILKFRTINNRTVRYGTESLTSLANKIWSLIPTEIKRAEIAQNVYFIIFVAIINVLLSTLNKTEKNEGTAWLAQPDNQIVNSTYCSKKPKYAITFFRIISLDVQMTPNRHSQITLPYLLLADIRTFVYYRSV